MKKHILLFLVFSALLFTSCENTVHNGNDRNQTEQEPKLLPENPQYTGKLKIGISNHIVSNSSRTLLPDIDVSNIISFSLSGVQEGVTKNFGSWTSYSALTSAEIELRTGAWSLTLTAEQNNGVTFTATTSATISAGPTQTVNFSLTTTSTIGGLSLTVNYTGDAASARYELYRISDSTLLNQGDLTVNTTAHKVVYEKPVETDGLAAGSYRIIIYFYGDADQAVLLNTYSEIAKVSGGFTSTATRTIDLNSMYSILYKIGGASVENLEGTPVSGSLVEKYSLHSTETSSIPLPDMERDNYVFDGWFETSTCTGSPVNSFTVTPTTVLENKTFYAKYRKICALSYKIAASEDVEVNLADLTAAQKTTYGIPVLPENHTEGETTDLPVLSFTDGVSASSPELFEGYHYTTLTGSTGPTLTGSGTSQKYVIGANDLSDNTTIYIKVNPINSYVDPNAVSDTVLAFNVSTPAKTVSAAKGWLKGVASTNNPKLYVKGAVNTAEDVGALSNLTTTTYGNAIVMRHSSLTAGNVVNFVSGTASLQNVTIDGGANWGTNHAADYVNESSNTGIRAESALIVVDTNATLNMTNVTIQNSENTRTAGSTFYIGGNVSMTSCTITDCKADMGGAIDVSGTLTDENSTISYNYGGMFSGGITADGTNEVHLKGTSFTGNKSTQGGAIYNQNRTNDLILEGCTFTSNNATWGRNIYHKGKLQLKGEITFNDKTSKDIYFDNSYTSTQPITFSSFTATGTGLKQTITPDKYYSGTESSKTYDKQIFDFSTFSTNTTLINTIRNYFTLASEDYDINTSGIITQTPGYITITPGFPDSYVCKWIQTISGGTRQINIIIQDRNGGSVSPATGSLYIGVYEGPDEVMHSTTTSFNYPSWLDPPSGTPFYVTFNVQVDDNTAYSYDYWPREGAAALGGGLYSIPKTTTTANLGSDVSSVFNGRNLKFPIGNKTKLIASDHEVTQGEYAAYCKYAGSQPSATYGLGANYPAYYVSWYDAIVYCNLKTINDPSLGLSHCVYSLNGEKDPSNWDYEGRDTSDGKYCGPSSDNTDWNGITFDQNADGWRLPTEAEWEFLARGGNLTTTGQTTYSGSNTVDDVAWYCDNSGDNGTSENPKAHEVKGKTANSLGLYDMSGNVWELCWDKFNTVETTTPADGPENSSSGSLHVTRGGSMSSGSSGCTVLYRDYHEAYSCYSNSVGFRVVRSSD